MKLKNKRALKPLLAVFLAAALLFGGIPAAYADDFHTAGNELELTNALVNVNDGGTIQLTANIDYNSDINIADKDITLDLDDFDLNVNAAAGLNLSNSEVTVAGAGSLNITSTGSHGLYLTNGAIEHVGAGSFNVTGATTGVNAVNGSEVTVTSAEATGTAAGNYGVYASGGSTVHVQGDVTGNAGIYAAGGLPSTVTVGDDVDAFGDEPEFGVYAADGSQISVSGDIYSSLGDAGVYAVGLNSYIHAGGVVVAAGTCGAWADNGGRVLVDGNIQGGAVGIGAENSGVAEAAADVTANGAGGVGAEVQSGGQVTVRGRITAEVYVKVDLVGKTISETTPPTTWLGYATYSEGGSLSVIWVRASNYEFSADPAELSSGGGDSVITLAGADLPDGITVTAFDGVVPALTGTTAGITTEQAVTLTFPENTSTTNDKIYTLQASQDGGMTWETGLVAEVTVRKVFTGPIILVPTPPAVVTDTVTNITSFGATLNGEVTDDGNAAITGRGFAYGASADPDISDPDVTQIPVNGDIGSFTAELTGLSAGTTYHVRAYAINIEGISYGLDTAFTTTPGSDGGGGGGGGGSSSNPASYYAIVKENNVQVDTLPVTVSSETKIGTVSLTGSKAEKYFTPEGGTVIAAPSIPGVKSLSLEMPAASLSEKQAAKSLVFATPYGRVAIPDGMLSALPGTGNKKAEIMIGQGDKTGLTDAGKEAVGGRPLIQISLKLDGKQTGWNNSGTPVTVFIPYKPTAAELADPESIIIWYIDGSGSLIPVASGHYDPAAGAVTFAATRCSLYAIGCNPVSFRDVAASAWYGKAVGFIAAREITAGTGGGNFSPQAKLTRGEFIVMLMKAYEIAPGAAQQDNFEDNFADAGSTYYTDYLATAKKLGISDGVGSNLFAPSKEITRQEMFTLLYNALKAIGQLPQVSEDSGRKTLSDFSDAEQIASWAGDSMSLLAEAGVITGSNGRLSPSGSTTRAEMAQVLYNLLSK